MRAGTILRLRQLGLPTAPRHRHELKQNQQLSLWKFDSAIGLFRN
jgi:hypothetical protein